MENNQPHGLSRRTVAKGAAWAVPAVVALGAAPMAAASSCTPVFTPQPGSMKCCNGPTNNMKLILLVTTEGNCTSSGSAVCIQDVYPSNGGTTGSVTFDPPSGCIDIGGQVTAYLGAVSNCTVNLTVKYSIDGGASQTTDLKSGNISSGNTAGACSPPGPSPASVRSASTNTSSSSTVKSNSAAQSSNTTAPSSTAPTSTSGAGSTTPAG